MSALFEGADEGDNSSTQRLLTSKTQAVRALLRQIDLTSEQLGRVEYLSNEKKKLIKTGIDVLQQHCVATQSCIKRTPLCSTAIVKPSPQGWEVMAEVRGPFDVLNKYNAYLAVVHPFHPLSCSHQRCHKAVPVPMDAGMAVVSLSAELHVSKKLLAQQSGWDHDAHIYIVLSDGESTSGSVDVYHVEALTLDPLTWLQGQACATSRDETNPNNAMELEINCCNDSLECIDWVEHALMHRLFFQRREEGRWCLGSHGVAQVTVREGLGSRLSIELTAQDITLLPVIREQLRLGIVEAAERASLPAPLIIERSKSGMLGEGTTAARHEGLLRAIDALLTEMKALRTWALAMKSDREVEDATYRVVQGDLQAHPLEMAQAQSLNTEAAQSEAMAGIMATDRAAISLFSCF